MSQQERKNVTLSQEVRQDALTIIEGTPNFFETINQLPFGTPNLDTIEAALISLKLNRGWGRYEGKSFRHMESLRPYATHAIINALTKIREQEKTVLQLESIYKGGPNMITGHEQEKTTEQSPLPTFMKTPIDPSDPTRCVDGRPALNSPQGAQMPGGALFPILLDAIANGKLFTEAHVSSGMNQLVEHGFVPGVHRGAHKHDDKSDCGFADQMPAIVALAISKRGEITGRMRSVYEQNRTFFDQASINLDSIIEKSYAALVAYDPQHITLTGENLVQTAEANKALLEDVIGDHAERVAFVNLVKGYTLDTAKLNQSGQQGFNLDLLESVEQAHKAFGVPEDVATGLALILYQATEIQLVENKGKIALPVVLHY